MSMSQDQKQAILERRAENQRIAVRIEQGTRCHEPVKVYGTDGQEHDVEVYALSDDQFREAFETAGVDPRDIGNRDKLTQNLKFVAAVAKLATGDPAITANVLPNEPAKLMMKAFEISRLTPAKVESFREGDLQSQPLRAD